MVNRLKIFIYHPIIYLRIARVINPAIVYNISIFITARRQFYCTRKKSILTLISKQITRIRVVTPPESTLDQFETYEFWVWPGSEENGQYNPQITLVPFDSLRSSGAPGQSEPLIFVPQ